MDERSGSFWDAMDVYQGPCIASHHNCRTLVPGDRQLDDLTSYAEDIGLAFQIADDVLNVTGTREELGKNPNTDAERGKKTYPTFYGAEGARKLADDCVARAIARAAGRRGGYVLDFFHSGWEPRLLETVAAASSCHWPPKS